MFLSTASSSRSYNEHLPHTKALLMSKDLLRFLFQESQQIEDAEGLSEDISAIFESENEEDSVKIVKAPLKKALKSLGIDAESLEVTDEGALLHTDCDKEYATVVNIITDPVNLYKLAEQGWVACVSGNITSTQDEDCYVVRFIEIDVAGEEADEEDLEKIIKNAQELGDSNEGPSQEDEKESNKENDVKESADDVVNRMLTEEYVTEKKNSDVIDMFLRNSFPKDQLPVWGTTNVKISKERDGWSLVNYFTRLLLRKNGEDGVYFNTNRYSTTTSTIQNYIKKAAGHFGTELIPVPSKDLDAQAEGSAKAQAPEASLGQAERDESEVVYTDLNSLLEKYSK